MKPDKRKDNPGRPKKNLEPTVPIRVPKSLGPWIQANIEAIRVLKDNS